MTDEHLTTELAVRAMRWRLAPGRFLKAQGWTSRSRFRPLVDIRDAFRVLDAVADDYTLLYKPGGLYRVHVCAAGRAGRAVNKSRTRAICMAVAQALEINITGEIDDMRFVSR